VDFFTRARLLPPGDERRRGLTLKQAVAYPALFHVVMDTPGEGAGTEILPASFAADPT
jgi:hypothetical protein